jgi:Sugar phosphate isomerases/epimerases
MKTVTGREGLTRRTFGKNAAAGLLAATLPLSAFSAVSKLKIGIGAFTYHNFSLDEMIAQLQTLKISEIEMSRGEFMLMNHPGDDLFRAARTKLDRANIRCVSYYSATIKEDQELESALRFAKILGAQNVTGDATGDILHHIDRRFSQEGMTFGIHNHFFKGEKFPYESPDDVLRALAVLSETVGATADVGQFASCGQDPLDAIRKLSSRLKLIHLKDIAAAGDDRNVVLGQGISKIPEVMQELRRQNFAHLIAIEYEKDGNINSDVQACVEYARKLS